MFITWQRDKVQVRKLDYQVNRLFLITVYKVLFIFLINSSSGNFAEMRDDLDSRGADWHRVSPNHFSKIHHEKLLNGEMNFFSCWKNKE